MERRDWSETAEPQKERLRCVRAGQPRERTSVEVSERAQQKDWKGGVRGGFGGGGEGSCGVVVRIMGKAERQFVIEWR